MELDEYQMAARKTDVASEDDAVVIALLGIVGEAGTLLAEYKKALRDGVEFSRFEDRLSEELGDLLWYVSSLASRSGLKLGEVAAQNLNKNRNRWSFDRRSRPTFFDEGFPIQERLPTTFRLRFSSLDENGTASVEVTDVDGKRVGDVLTDNSWKSDGYRFHDVIHFANVALLGWSPVSRKLFGCKRKSQPRVDEVEDGARATILEEAICATIHAYAEDHDYLQNAKRVDWDLLRSIERLSRGFEVAVRTPADWEFAIIQGVRAWKQLIDADGGLIVGDAERRQFCFRPLSATS